MQKYYIPHKVKEGDITHLADNDSLFAISNGIAEEDLIDIQSTNGIYQAIVTFIQGNSVEVEVLKKLESIQPTYSGITVLQGISNSTKFGLFLEKITEIGVDTVIPLYSELCLIKPDKFEKELGLYTKIIKDAVEQSRNPNPPVLEEVLNIQNINTNTFNKDSLKLCFATENVELKNLKDIHISKGRDLVLAFGPESGWSVKDIEKFKSLGFIFVYLQGNILRTETTPIVATSIIKFIQQKI